MDLLINARNHNVMFFKTNNFLDDVKGLKDFQKRVRKIEKSVVERFYVVWLFLTLLTHKTMKLVSNF